MAGFEVIVRPVVFPNIRPQPSRSLPPADNSEQGRFTFSGSSGTVIALNYTFSASGSMSGGAEYKRTFDEVRIYQVDDAGNVNHDNYVDVEIVKKVNMRKRNGETSQYSYAPFEETPEDTGRYQIRARNKTRSYNGPYIYEDDDGNVPGNVG